MELRNRIVGAVGTAALVLGMSAGIASADTSSIQTSVEIDCPTPATVELTTQGTGFAPVNILEDDSSETSEGHFLVTVDMGCYWGDWQVNASITRFQGPLLWFSGDKFSLEDADVESYALDPLDPFNFLGPVATDAEFSGIPGPPAGDAGSDNAIFETRFSFLYWLFTGQDLPAPFVSEASYTGVLSDLPFLLDGTYTATLTVELTLD